MSQVSPYAFLNPSALLQKARQTEVAQKYFITSYIGYWVVMSVCGLILIVPAIMGFNLMEKYKSRMTPKELRTVHGNKGAAGFLLFLYIVMLLLVMFVYGHYPDYKGYIEYFGYFVTGMTLLCLGLMGFVFASSMVDVVHRIHGINKKASGLMLYALFYPFAVFVVMLGVSVMFLINECILMRPFLGNNYGNNMYQPSPICYVIPNFLEGMVSLTTALLGGGR